MTITATRQILYLSRCLNRDIENDTTFDDAVRPCHTERPVPHPMLVICVTLLFQTLVFRLPLLFLSLPLRVLEIMKLVPLPCTENCIFTDNPMAFSPRQ